MTDFAKTVSLRLKIARIAAGFKTSREFAEKHVIPTSTYCQHETGKRPLSIDQLFYYSKLTQVEPAWLLTGDGNPCSDADNKEMEQRILQEQERLGGSGELASNAIPLISDQDRFAYVNMSVFKKILQESIPLIIDANLHVDEAIDFCFDLYNKIITLDARDEDRVKVIKIGLKSFFDGLRIRSRDENKLASA